MKQSVPPKAGRPYHSSQLLQSELSLWWDPDLDPVIERPLCGASLLRLHARRTDFRQLSLSVTLT